MTAVTPMAVYDGVRSLGEIEDHAKEGVRTYLGVGRVRQALGVYATRRDAMGAISAAAKADQAGT